MRILIAGASGMLGGALQASLTAQGHDVRTLSRSAKSHEQQWNWTPDQGYVPMVAIDWAEAVVNLAGAPLAQIPWTQKRKQGIVHSRLNTTKTLAQSIKESNNPPHTWINASAVGYYGSQPGIRLDETSNSGEGFLAQLCRHWENATGPTTDHTRVIQLRTGIVLAEQGALQPLALATKLGLGARLGSGQQVWPWISKVDHVRAMEYALFDQDIVGPVNLVAPTLDTANDITQTLAFLLHRPHIFALPAPLMRLAIGQVADEMLLADQHVHPKKLLTSGFEFQQADIWTALAHIYR